MDSSDGNPLKKHTIRSDTGFRHRKKYENKNFVHQWALKRFFTAVGQEIDELMPAETLDFGTGEGYFLQTLEDHGIQVGHATGIDIRAEAIAEARKRCPRHTFEPVDLLTWDLPEKSFDLVIASQVLEHLSNPLIYLMRLAALTRDRLLLTVPCEPWFRLSNLIRGRDMVRLGNHPEHVNLWRFRQFVDFVGEVVQVEKAYTVLPFTIIVARRMAESRTRSIDQTR